MVRLETGLHPTEALESRLGQRRVTRARVFSRHDTRHPTPGSNRPHKQQEKGMDNQGQREGERDLERWTRGWGGTHLLQHLAATRLRAMLLGPESGMREYAGARLSGTFGVPLRVYPGLKIKCLHLPAFLRALRSFALQVIHLIDPIWLGVQALLALQMLFPSTPIVTSHHTNLPTYGEIFGYTLVPSPSTARLLRESGWGNLRVVERGVDGGCGCFVNRPLPHQRGVLSVGRLSPEKNQGLVVLGVARLDGARDRTAARWRGGCAAGPAFLQDSGVAFPKDIKRSPVIPSFVAAIDVTTAGTQPLGTYLM
ncbi:hypothetical protein B0H13DRAFT_2312717 [Mycena leptocephala]|nr:hypothetical protein B0H13DRAFT_2312717 [Mycena leptocephala]